MKWFGKSREGGEHDFPGDEHHPPTTWILHSKLGEKFLQDEEELATMKDGLCAAWATFLHSDRKYVMKIYMQIPWEDSEMEPAPSRESQVRKYLLSSPQNELKALSELKEHQSTGTPILVDYFHGKQSANMCAPGGFLLFILMTHCPGVPVLDFRSKPLAERKEIRQAFRIAYEYVLCLGLSSS